MLLKIPLLASPSFKVTRNLELCFLRQRYGCLRPAKMCKADDVLISVRAPVGAINIADRDYCIGRGLAAIRVRGLKPSMSGEIIARQSSSLRRIAQGTTFEAINKRDLLSLQLTLPPSNELRQVESILDAVDTSIHETEAII
ncbi:MAG: restriction endonuclease subunit S, partial [Betaproteobacteria bacterium]|nr:restriction endonuclease subunit S [Betaproteobacteria bacterium]